MAEGLATLLGKIQGALEQETGGGLGRKGRGWRRKVPGVSSAAPRLLTTAKKSKEPKGRYLFLSVKLHSGDAKGRVSNRANRF